MVRFSGGYEMRESYDFSNGVRGKYAPRMAAAYWLKTVALAIILSLAVIAVRQYMHWPRWTGYGMIFGFVAGRATARYLKERRREDAKQSKPE
jgi:hypothetical protein